MTALLGFTGDVFLGAHRAANVFASVVRSLPSSTQLVVNFEGTLCVDPSALTPARQKILLTSPVSAASVLDELPTLAFCVGNNHIGDYGNDISTFTIQHLAQGHPVFGAGLETQPSNTLLVSYDGVGLGLASYCDRDSSPLHATANRIGPRPFTHQTAAADVDRLREKAAYCVALLHWGDEDHHYPREDQVRRARALIDAGYSLVIGSHSHTAQGYERYRHGWIFYSLGNFYFPDHHVTIDGTEHAVRWMRRRSWGLLPLFRITADGIALHDVLVTTHRRNAPPRLTRSALRYIQLRAYSLPLSSSVFARVSLAARRLEDVAIRLEEFSNNRHKSRTLFRKARTVLRIPRPEAGRSRPE